MVNCDDVVCICRHHYGRRLRLCRGIYPDFVTEHIFNLGLQFFYLALLIGDLLVKLFVSVIICHYLQRHHLRRQTEYKRQSYHAGQHFTYACFHKFLLSFCSLCTYRRGC